MITWISAVAAVVCLVYYVIIVLYAGFSTSFSWIWLAGAALLAMTGWGSHEYRLSLIHISVLIEIQNNKTADNSKEGICLLYTSRCV